MSKASKFAQSRMERPKWQGQAIRAEIDDCGNLLLPDSGDVLEPADAMALSFWIQDMFRDAGEGLDFFTKNK